MPPRRRECSAARTAWRSQPHLPAPSSLNDSSPISLTVSLIGAQQRPFDLSANEMGLMPFMPTVPEGAVGNSCGPCCTTRLRRGGIFAVSSLRAKNLVEASAGRLRDQIPQIVSGSVDDSRHAEGVRPQPVLDRGGGFAMVLWLCRGGV